MKDYLDVLGQYKYIDEIADLVKELQALRDYYYNRRDDDMPQHIFSLMVKYCNDTFQWNVTHPIMPQTIKQQFLNAEDFLFYKGLQILLKNGIKVAEELMGR